MMFKLKIPPPIYALLFAWLMWIADSYFPLADLINPPWNKLALIILPVAIFIDFWSLFLFFRAHTSPSPLHPEKASHLVTSGIYRYSRNPMYLGLVLLLVSWGIFLGSLVALLLIPLFVFLLTGLQIIPEEKILDEKFGQQYREYKQKVRRWL